MGDIKTKYDILTAQDMKVVKGNALIQKSRYSLSVMEQKIVLYMISKIKPTDTPDTDYVFNIDDFCQVCCFDNSKGRYNNYIQPIIEELGTRVLTIDMGNGKTLISHWFSSTIIDNDKRTFTVSFDSHIKPYLFELSKFYTQYSLEYVLGMKSKYSPRLYEFLCSISNLTKQPRLTIDELRTRIGCEDKYPNWKDFKKNVLEPAIDEIKHYTDISVSYETFKEGKYITEIQFTITRYDEETLDEMFYLRYYDRRNKQLEKK